MNAVNRSTGDLVLGIDIGTSSSKGVLVRPDGAVVATAIRPHELSLPQPGWVEHDAEAVWWGDFVAIARELSDRTASRIVAVGVSGIGPAVVPVDVHGRALRPAILYGIDTRAAAEVEELTRRFGSEAILARGGTLLTSQAAGPKLAWIRRHEPQVWANTRRFHMAHSLIVERLTGEYVLDHHAASQCDPLYDMRTHDWAWDWADQIIPGIELPALAWSDEVIGRVRQDASAITGIPAGTPVVAGTIDAWAEALSVGVRQPGETMLMYGTTMFIVEIASAFCPERRLWTTEGLFKGSVSHAAGLSASGGLIAWFREIVDQDFDSLAREASGTPAGADGLIVLPFFGVARSPIFDTEARGAVFGLTLRHRRGHLYRALLEGTAYEVRHNLEVMSMAGVTPLSLTAVGGGTKGVLWPQVVSDVTGLSQILPSVTVGASLGDALLAARGVGIAENEAHWNPPARWIKPSASGNEHYNTLYRIYRSLYDATRELSHEITRLPPSSLPSSGHR